MVTKDADTAEVLQAVTFSVFSPYVGVFIERGINLDNFAINLDQNKDILVELEKRLFNNRITVRYQRLFSQNVEEEIEARYEFRKRSFLKWGIDQDNQTDYQVEYRLRF